ncbi:MAG TPA: tyrosine-type recombinase/integrase [Rhizobiaceae bacterium]|nr:tyrosine-type recombinase/integrase [Rhizobiaceae bacterium]
MAKRLSEGKITTANARKSLAEGVHWRRLDADCHLGYRRGKRSVWLVRWRNHFGGANYRQAPIGIANDMNDRSTPGALTFDEAEKLARVKIAEARSEAAITASGPVSTVASAVEAYIRMRDGRHSKRAGRPVRSDAGRRLRRYVLGQPARGRQPEIQATELAGLPLHKLTERSLSTWREGLPEDLKPTSKQRLFNDLKAALNEAAKTDRDRLPANLPSIIKHGLRAISDDAADNSVARENQILADKDIARLVAAAKEVDDEQGWNGDLFRLVLVLAATGARFSQLVRARVSDLQLGERRILVPASRKGKGKAGSIAVPLGDDVLNMLKPAADNRPADAYLLERWRSVQVAGSVGIWERNRRGPWQASSELTRPWAEIRDKAELPAVIPYALRHSSIVKGIRANLPIRLVAALHDTSVIMIERHYSKWITSGLEDMARGAIVPLIPEGEHV